MNVGQWSKRRHKVNERIASWMSRSFRIGHTETIDDERSIQDWMLILMSRMGKASTYAEVMRRDAIPQDEDNPFESEIVAIAGICHSILESFDRRRDVQRK